MSGLSVTEKPNDLRSLQVFDGTRLDAREVLPKLSKEQRELTTELKELTEQRYGSSNTLSALEELARKRPQERDENRIGLSPREIHSLLVADLGVDSTITQKELESSNERAGKNRKSKSPALRAVASYLTDGMPVFREGSKVKVILRGSKEDDKKSKSHEDVVIVVNETIFKEYQRLTNAGNQISAPNTDNGNTILEITISKNLDPELVRSILKDRFNIADDESIPILKIRDNLGPGLFYWHDGQIKFDAKIIEEKSGTKLTRKARSLFLANAFVRSRNEVGNVQVGSVNLNDAREENEKGLLKRATELLARGGQSFVERVQEPINRFLNQERTVAGETNDYVRAMWGYDQNRLAASGEIKMASDEVILAVLKHVYSRDFDETLGGDEVLLKEVGFDSVNVLRTMERIIATQELARIVFEYTLGASDISEHKKQVSPKFAEDRKSRVKSMIEEYRKEYALAESSVSSVTLSVDNTSKTRSSALLRLLEASWEIAQFNSVLNKESGDWEEAAKEISGLVREDAYAQTKLVPNIQRVYSAINALGLPGLTADSVMENYYWNLGYKVVSQSEGKKFRLVPRTAKFIDRKGNEQNYVVSTNYNLLRNCFGFYNGLEIEKSGEAQMARLMNPDSTRKLSKLEPDQSNEFLPQFLERDEIDRETPIVAPLVNLFSASSTFALIGINAGIAMCTFDGLGRMQDTGEDVFANEENLDASSYSKFTRQGHSGTSGYTSLRGWKRLVEVFQPGIGFIWGAQQFFDTDIGREMALDVSRTGRRLVPIDILGTPGNEIGRDVFIPANYKYYAYDENGDLCVQTFNRDFATRINSTIASLAKANTRIFGPLEEGFDGFNSFMNERDSSVSSRYNRLVANLVHKAFIAKLIDALLTSAKEASAVGNSEVKDGKVKDKISEFVGIVQSTSTLDKLYKGFGGDLNALVNTVAFLPTFAEGTVIVDIASSTNVARATTIDAVTAPAEVYENLLRGPLANADVFIGPVFSTIIDVSGMFPSILADSTNTTASLTPRSVSTLTKSLEVTPEGNARISNAEAINVTHNDITIDFGSGYKAAVEAMTKPDSGIIEVNRNLALGGLLSFIQWFGSNFKMMSGYGEIPTSRGVYEAQNGKEGLTAGERKTRLISIRKALNEVILTMSMFYNRDRSVLASSNVNDLGSSQSRFVRDYIGYTVKPFIEAEEDDYVLFLESKFKNMLDICFGSISRREQLELLEVLKNTDHAFFTEKGVPGSFKEELLKSTPFGEIVGIASLDSAWERALHNCVVSFQAVGIAERLNIEFGESFRRIIFDQEIIESESFIDISLLEKRIVKLVEEGKLKKIPSDKLKTIDYQNMVTAEIEYLASKNAYGPILEATAKITSDVANIQTESKPATRDILGHIATRVQRISTAMTWGSFFFAVCPDLDKNSEVGGIDFSTSPGLLFLRQLRERDSSLRDAYNAISTNLNLALLQDGQLMDGYGRQLDPKLRRAYPSNIFKPSELRIKLMSDPDVLPKYPMEVRTPEFKQKIRDDYMRVNWFSVMSPEQQEEIIESYTDFLYSVALDRAAVLTRGQPVRMAPVISNFEEGMAVLSDLAPFYPAAQALILGGELTPPDKVLRPEDYYSAVNRRIDGTVDGIGAKILEDVELKDNMETMFFGLDAKAGKLKTGLEWLMFGTRHEHREPSLFGRNSKIVRLWTGEQDPIYFLQRKLAIEAESSATQEALKKNINLFGFIDLLPKIIGVPLRTLGLTIEDFGLKNVLAHSVIGGSLAVPLTVGLSSIALIGPFLPITVVASGAIAFSIFGGWLSNKIERALANQDTKTKNRPIGGIFAGFNAIIGNSIPEQDHIWSSTFSNLSNVQKARTIADTFDWKKGLPKGTNKLFTGAASIISFFLPEVPIVGPVLKLFGDANDTSVRVTKSAVGIALTSIGSAALVGGSIGIVPGLVLGGLVGLYSGIKNIRSLDTSLPLITTDLPSTEKSAVAGKRVNEVFLRLLNIKPTK